MPASRASLSLQLSLYRRQKARINRSVIGTSPVFRRYEARYRRATKSYSRVSSLAEVRKAVLAADVVYVGDYHTLKLAQTGYLELAREAAKCNRRVVLALELVEGRHQPTLDDFLAGKLTEAQFLEAIGHPYRGAFDIWPNFAPVLELAREKGMMVLAIDKRSRAKSSLDERDRFAAEQLAAVARAEDRPLILVLMGQFHITPAHLPACTREALGDVEREHLVVYQNAEGIYWQLAAQGIADTTEAVEVRPGEMAIVSASPVICQQSFLDYLEAELGDSPLEDSAAASTFKDLARALGRLVNVDVTRALRDVEIATAGDLTLFERLSKRGHFRRGELDQLRRHVLSRESAYIPRARLAYLASLSLNHAAEEATHFVRHVAVGPAMERPRRRSDAFWARCLEEALGFFGSRLLNPKRRCTQLAEWSAMFSGGSPAQRDVSAFVLALKAAEAEGPAASRRLIPMADDHLFHAVSHALGYLLGEALARAFEDGRLTRKEMRSLFVDPFPEPADRYFTLASRLFSL
ncbi:MAG: ChaN family lipoprotein [Archangiaceae bacterium]|nr:ChaN family lipoprotein [Archangiaceae bacterium]